jgi:hypothetical protein
MKPHERIPKSYYLANILNIRHYIGFQQSRFLLQMRIAGEIKEEG